MQPKLWPDLSSAGALLGVIVAEEDGRIRPQGLAVVALKDEHAIDLEALEDAGFVRHGDTDRWDRMGTRIDFDELRAIVPGFDPALHLGTAAPQRFTVTAPEEVSSVAPAMEVEPETQEAAPADEEATEPSSDRKLGEEDLGYRQPRKGRNPDERIEDYGEKIGGAKKDTRGKGGRRLTKEDFAGRTQAQLVDDLSLSKLWPFSYPAAKEAGMSPKVAAWVMAFRRELRPFSKLFGKYPLANSDSGDTNEGQAEIYAQAVTLLAESFQGLRTEADFKTVMDDLRVRLFAEGHYKLSEDSGGNSPWRSGRSMSYPTSVGILIAHYLPGRRCRLGDFFDEWRSGSLPLGWDHAQSKARFPRRRDEEGYYREVEDPEVLWEHLIGRTARAPRRSNEGPATPDRPHLDDLKYEGFPLRREGDVSAEEFATAFGFRAVEFGEWLPQGERQVVLNMAYDALMTQADIMGLPPRMMSFDGRLAAAFGSRGNGGKRSAMAHYEPSTKAFNLTRIKGAGSLGHEYGHALDHWMLDMIQPDHGGRLSLQRADWAFTQAMRDNWAMLDEEQYAWAQRRVEKDACEPDASQADKLRPYALQVTRKMAEIHERMHTQYVPVSPEAKLEALRNERDYRIDQAAGWMAQVKPFKRWEEPRAIVKQAVMEGQMNPERIFSGDHSVTASNAFGWGGENVVEAYRAGLEKAGCSPARASRKWSNACRNLAKAGELAAQVMYLEQPPEVRARIDAQTRAFEGLLDHVKHQSEFLKQACKLDEKRAKAYWSERHELFARAFESWLFDEIRQSGRADYLVHGVEEDRYADDSLFAGNPYPCGEERKELGTLMHGLMGAVAQFVRERDKLLHPERAAQKQAEMAF